jgi:hypothetical protein
VQNKIFEVLHELAGQGLLANATGHRIAARLAASAGNLCATPDGCRTCTVQCRDEIVISRL